MVSAPAALEFPTDYPLKVVGRPDDEFRERVHEIVLRHTGEPRAARRWRGWSQNSAPAPAC